MAYVPVPKDLSKVKTKVAFNLTKRQIVCFAVALLLGLPLFFLLKDSTGTSLASTLFKVSFRFFINSFERAPWYLLLIFSTHTTIWRLIMKKKIYLLAGTLFVLSLCSCSIQISTDGNHQESSSATTSSSSSGGNSSEAPSTPEISNGSDISISDSTADSPSATPDVISSSTSSSDSNESPSDTQVSPDTYTLTRYDSIYDVPYAKLDYKSYVEEDGDSGHYTLTKDGIPWVGTPGTDQFGDICFSDGRNLYIQCFLSYNDTLSTDFRWFCVNFNHFDDEDSHFLPDETMNKLFTGSDGETLYTDDGYQYKLSTMPWCQDGTCKR